MYPRIIVFASSFDQIGPFARSVEDIALLYEVMAGADKYDNTVSKREVESVQSAPEPGKKRIAYFRNVMESDHLDPEVRKASEAIIEKLKARDSMTTVKAELEDMRKFCHLGL